MDYSMENFISWCDSMTIAEEETYYGDTKTQMNIKQARPANTMEAVNRLIKQETAIIALGPDLEEGIKEVIKKKKAKLVAQFVGLFIPIVQFGIMGWMLADGLTEKDKILSYRIYFNKKEKPYLIRKDIDIIE